MRRMGHHTLLTMLVLGSSAAPLWAVPITTLFSTGVNDAGFPLADGAVDPHWRLVSSPDAAYPGSAAPTISNSAPPLQGGYVPNTLTSRWISARPDGGHNFPRSDCSSGCTTADYYFQTTFDLTGLDPDTVEITGQWALDDSGYMLLNGAPTGVSRPYVQRLNWSTWASFILDSGFLPGPNTLTVVVNNGFFPNSALRDNPTGLHVMLSGTASVPEPASVLLLIVSGLMLPRSRRPSTAR